MMDEPLHVQVARALGWTDLRPSREYEIDWQHAWFGHHEGDRGDEIRVPDYDTDWSATGPLIEQYGIRLLTPEEGVGDEYDGWHACAPGESDFADCVEFGTHRYGQDGDVPWGCGDTPLITVCRLILALKAAGKLT